MSTRPGQLPATVLRREQWSDHLVRIVLGGDELAGFTSTGVPDEWVALVVPGQFQSRYYTVRSFENGELTLDVVVHESGLVTEWAQGDCVGDVVHISEPKGSFALPETATWVRLLGDLTALPAIARIRESLSDFDGRVEAWVESPDGPIEGYVDGVEWLDAPPDGSRLAAWVEEAEWPEGEGYFWMAGESAQMREIRRFVRRRLGWDNRRLDLMGYWSNARGRQRRAVDPGPIYAAGKAAGKSDAEIWAEYDEARDD